jgi:hypothetical protein
MTDQRPRPQYGEYATPQAQAQAMGLSSPGHAPAPAAGPAAPTAAGAAAPTARGRRGQANLVVTVALLALGLVNVATSIGSYLDLPGAIQTVYDQLGYGTYTADALAHSLGILAVVLSVVIWLATAAVCALLIRKHRLSWWVPLVGAAVLFVAIAIVMTVAVASDPAFAAGLQRA